jgi:hypothetical protein
LAADAIEGVENAELPNANRTLFHATEEWQMEGQLSRFGSQMEQQLEILSAGANSPADFVYELRL